MRTSTIGVLALLTLATPGTGAAQSRLAIGTIRGDASRVRRQILLQLCESYDCVAASRVTTNSRPDPQKLQRAGVAGYLGGAVTGEPGERRLILTLTTPTSTARKPARTWRLRLTPDGRIRPQVLDRFGTELDQALQGAGARPAPSPAAPPERPQPPPTPPPAAKPPPAKAPPQPPPVAEPAETPKAKPAEAPRAKPAEPARRTPSAEGPLKVAAEAGLWVTNRKLTWSGATSGTDGSLRTYDASAVFVPSLRLELYPAAWADAGPLVAGIGVYAEYGQSVGLKVKPPSGMGGGNRPGKLTTLDLGAVWRLQPISGSRFVLAPALGYRSLQVTTGGDAIDGLPDTKPSGYELRVDTQIPATPSFAILAGGGYTLWTSKKEIVKGFFGKGSARGLEIEAGASYRFWGPVSAKAMIEWQSISYSGLKDPRASPSYGTASSASDSYLGARLMLRAEY